MSEGIDSENFADLKICLEDLNKLNNEYIQFKLTNHKKRGKKKKFAEFIRLITTVSVEISENESFEKPEPEPTKNKRGFYKKKNIQSPEISKENESKNSLSLNEEECTNEQNFSGSKVSVVGSVLMEEYPQFADVEHAP